MSAPVSVEPSPAKADIVVAHAAVLSVIMGGPSSVNTTGASLVGRTLKSLRPQEIESLLRVVQLKTGLMTEPTGHWRARLAKRKSHHPRFPIYWMPPEPCAGEGEKFFFVTKDELGTEDFFIRIGSVSGDGGPFAVVAVVHWFLSHGWSWSRPVTPAPAMPVARGAYTPRGSAK